MLPDSKGDAGSGSASEEASRPPCPTSLSASSTSSEGLTAPPPSIAASREPSVQEPQNGTADTRQTATLSAAGNGQLSLSDAWLSSLTLERGVDSREDGGWSPSLTEGYKSTGEFDPMESLAASEASSVLGEHRGVNPSIEPSTTFSFHEPSDMGRFYDREMGRGNEQYMYSRGFNPTVLHLGHQLAAMEGTEAAYCCSSGMAAISSVLLQLVSAGDHIVASNRLYGGTCALFNDFMQRFNVQVSYVDITRPEEVDESFLSGRTKVLYFESMANPALTVPDMPVLAAIAHKHHARAVVDNTFAPLVLSPARWGVDIVLHSLTKFINGASDLTGGAVCGPLSLIQQLNDYNNGTFILLGGVMQPQTAWQISSRLPHLGIRMQEHSARALLFARRLESLGVKVAYPGLPSHPDHEPMARLHNPRYGYGGMLTIDAQTTEKAEALMRYAQNQVHFGHSAVSLGFHDTLMCISGPTTAHNLTEEEKAAAGVSPGLIRISLGFTGSGEQRWAQLYEALVAVGVVAKGAKWRE